MTPEHTKQYLSAGCRHKADDSSLRLPLQVLPGCLMHMHAGNKCNDLSQIFVSDQHSHSGKHPKRAFCTIFIPANMFSMCFLGLFCSVSTAQGRIGTASNTERKENCTLFSGHNMSLPRRQPGGGIEYCSVLLCWARPTFQGGSN